MKKQEHDDRKKQSEERLLALIKATSDVIYRMSPDWSTMSELYGKEFLVDTEEPDPDWLDKYIHPNDQPRVNESKKKLYTRKKDVRA